MVAFARGLLPQVPVDGREEGVAIEGARDLGDDHFVRHVERRIEDLGAADDARFLFADQGDGGLERGHGFHALVAPPGVARDDDIAPARQRTADGVEGLATHDDRAAEGDALEVGQVFGQVPGKLVVDADAALRVDGDDHGQAGHRATAVDSAERGGAVCM